VKKEESLSGEEGTNQLVVDKSALLKKEEGEGKRVPFISTKKSLFPEFEEEFEKELPEDALDSCEEIFSYQDSLLLLDYIITKAHSYSLDYLLAEKGVTACVHRTKWLIAHIAELI